MLELGAKWTPLLLGNLLSDLFTLSALQGRDAVFDDDGSEDGGPSFADDAVTGQPFQEQIDFFRQKRLKPTKAWTDAMRGVHDRAFVVAGATDMDMLADFQNAIGSAIENGGTIEDFRKDFDRIVAKYGWQYKGERGFRSRVMFETNIRTSYMAGRLKQMRDPAVIKARPFWEYRHAMIRVPRNPRTLHVKWNGLCLAHDDPWWDTHFPPNGWFCTCGVRTLSLADLKRRGKDGPDKAPEDLMVPALDPVSGQLVERPQGIGFGWDYQPGHLWEQGLVPSALMDEGGPSLDNPRMAVSIDTPEPMADLLANAKPFAAAPLEDGLQPEDYVRAFLQPFGADLGQAVLFEDATGTKIPISDQLFRDRAGNLKVMKHDRATITPLLAEALRDPDEIWLGVANKTDPRDSSKQELVVDRRYIRADPKNGLMIVFEIGERFWQAITAYNTTTKKGTPDLGALDRRRGGKLLFKRQKR